MRLLAGLLVISLLLAGCMNSRPVHRVSLREAAPREAVSADASPATKPIRVAAASIISPQETIRSYGAFFAYLEKKAGRPIELLQRSTYEETYDLLRYGTLDAALVCTYVYLIGHDQLGLEVLGAPEVNGKAEYRSYIIVRAESEAERLTDLEGKRFAYTDPLSTSGRIYPLSRIKAMGADPGTFFGFTTYTYSHDNSIKAVVQGLVDGAAVDSLVYDQWIRLNPDLAARLRVIERSDPFPSPPMAVSQTVDPEVREALRVALLEMHKEEEGRKILQELGIDRFVPQDVSQYEAVRKVAQLAGMLP